MTLTAFPHNLFAPAFEISELTKVESQFSKKWLGQHEVPEEPLFHYTTAQGMRGILGERRLWLSDITSFNDPGEIEYGKRLVLEIMGGFEQQETDPVVRIFLSGMRPFVESFGTTLHRAFVACFCKSANLLSQWRGYADQGRGYSLGFRFSATTRIVMDNSKLAEGKEVYFRKVIYCPKEQRQWIESYLRRAISAVRTAEVSTAEAGALSLQAVNIILDMLLCFKHGAFAEENEWRLLRATLENHEPEGLRFRESAGLLVPYRPTFLFDAQKNGGGQFPLQSITFGPTLEPGRARSAIGLLLNHLESDSSPIKLLRSDVTIIEPGFPLRFGGG